MKVGNDYIDKLAMSAETQLFRKAAERRKGYSHHKGRSLANLTIWLMKR